MNFEALRSAGGKLLKLTGRLDKISGVVLRDCGLKLLIEKIARVLLGRRKRCIDDQRTKKDKP